MPLWLRFAVFFGVLAVLLVGASFYVHRRAAGALGLERRGRWILGLVLGGGILAAALGRVGGRGLPADLAEAVAVFGSTVLLAVVISVALLLLVDVARATAALVRRLRRGRAEAEALEVREAADGLTRRAFLSQSATGAALVIGTGTSTYGALFGRHDYRIDEVAVSIPGLPRTLDGFTIVQLSDIHFGTFVGEPELHTAVELVREAKPDLVVLTGDLLDHDAAYAPMLGRLVRRLEPLARHGVVAVPGNHDYYAGVDVVLHTLADAGATALRNQGRVIGDRAGAFALLGVDDVWATRNGFGTGPDLSRALSMVPRDLPRILLCHNPVFFPEAAAEVQLQLSGHTHGGQVNVAVRLADHVLPYGYVAGRYDRDGAVLYVNRGFGTAGPPARIGAPPEVTKLVLTAA